MGKNSSVQAIVATGLIIHNPTTINEMLHSLSIEDVSLSDIYKYIDHGTNAKAKPEIVLYINLLEMAFNMHNRVDDFGSRERIINHFVKIKGISRYHAGRIHDDMTEYYFVERNVSREAQRNMLAARMERNILLQEAAAKDNKELNAANKQWLDVWKIKRLDQPDPIEIDEAPTEPWIIYTADLEIFGLPPLNRSALLDQINSLPDVTEKEREKAKRDAGLKNYIMFEELEDED
ncbi:hypothetical protein [Nonlabens dokdonensis]|uniref:hypothetical protein n=1 Tax=Nonlabens dokdonensis TaxID=328515 RepID=UPI0026EB0D02|nr:hypothetical protein [Nonlabens dokdonensis]